VLVHTGYRESVY